MFYSNPHKHVRSSSKSTLGPRVLPLASLLLAGLCCLSSTAVQATEATPERPPNIVLIMADDLGYGGLSCYGQQKYQTPNIDRLAQQGMRFTNCYAGSCVCAPSRSVLMTGLHSGHTPVRANGGAARLYPDDVTIAEVLKQAGYATGMFGKWGLGVEGTTGHPNRQGFDEFFGYLHQVHAHFYFPYFLWENEQPFPLPENEGRKQGRYAHDEIHKHALQFLRTHQKEPFFCYLPYTIPHVELVVPDDSRQPFAGKWEETPLADPRKGYIGAEQPYATFAGMVTRLDRHVGEIVALLKELGLEDNTLIVFTSDNGGQAGAWERVNSFFKGCGPYRGVKGQFYEGGIRVPYIACWPGHIKPGSTSDHVFAFWDILPTLAEIAHVPTPPNIDGVSFAPALLGAGTQKQHEFFYWEYPYAKGLVQAVRAGDWKILQPKPGRPFELYNLKDDPYEMHNLAQKHPMEVERLQKYLTNVRTEARDYSTKEPYPNAANYVR